MRLIDWPTHPDIPKEHHHMTVTLRWLFALVTVLAGLYVLIESAGNKTAVATGVGLISAGVGLVAP